MYLRIWDVAVVVFHLGWSGERVRGLQKLSIRRSVSSDGSSCSCIFWHACAFPFGPLPPLSRLTRLGSRDIDDLLSGIDVATVWFITVFISGILAY